MLEKHPNDSVALNTRLLEWGFAVFLSAVVAVVAVVSVPNYSPTNDDNVIADILSGFFSGSPDYHTVYVGEIYSWLISSLYTVVPTIDWWIVAHEFVLFAACTVCVRCVVYKHLLHPARSLGFAAGIMVAAAFYIPFSSLNLATTSAAAGAAALALLMAKASGSEAYSSPDVLMVSIFLFLTYSYRQATFNVVAALVLATLLYGLIEAHPGAGRASDQSTSPHLRLWAKSALMLLVLPALLAVNSAAHAVAYGSSSWREFTDYNRARSTYLDYRTTSYANDEELFDSLGVSAERAYLINNWCMTEDVVDESLYLEISSNVSESNNASVTSVAKQALVENPVAALMHGAIAFCAVCTVVVLTVTRNRREALYAIYCGGILAASLICLFYVSSLNRVVLRALLSYLLPMVVVSVLVLVRAAELCDRRMPKDLALSFIAILLAGTALFSHEALAEADGLQLQATLTSRYEAVLEYGAAHPDAVVLRDNTISQDRRMFSTRRTRGSHDNCITLGAWYVGSPVWRSQLEANDIKLFTLEQLLRNDVFYASVKQDSIYWYGSAIEAYMYEAYGTQCHFELCEQLDAGVGIYKLVLDL